jgi:hypothetical protein
MELSTMKPEESAMLNPNNGLFHRDLVAAAVPGDVLKNRGPRLHDWWYKSPPPPDPDPPKVELPQVEVGEYRGIVFRDHPIEERWPAVEKWFKHDVIDFEALERERKRLIEHKEAYERQQLLCQKAEGQHRALAAALFKERSDAESSIMKLIAAVLFALVALTASASASPSCPTRYEARANHPSSHLYWHGEDRCWDTRPGRRHEARVRHRADRHHEARETPTPRPRPAAAPPLEPVPPPAPRFVDVWSDRVAGAVESAPERTWR